MDLQTIYPGRICLIVTWRIVQLFLVKKINFCQISIYYYIPIERKFYTQQLLIKALNGKWSWTWSWSQKQLITSQLENGLILDFSVVVFFMLYCFSIPFMWNKMLKKFPKHHMIYDMIKLQNIICQSKENFSPSDFGQRS